MSKSIAALTKCSNYNAANIREAIVRQFELLGGLEKFVSRGDSVLLKPNFIAPKPRHHATQTDPAVIIEVARLLKDFGARPFVADSPAWSNVQNCVKALKLDEPLEKLGVPFRQLNDPKTCKVGSKHIKVGISSVALDADVIINLPKFKAHQQLVGTFAVKNMFGVVCGKKKAYWHFAKGNHADDFCGLLIDIYRFMGPALTITDGVMAMDGPGPISGRARSLGYLIGSCDPMACEAVCCKLIGLNPQELPMIHAAKKMGFGNCDDDQIEVLGDQLSENICSDFEIPELVPIRFSVFQVFRSIAKQILILARSKGKKHPSS